MTFVHRSWRLALGAGLLLAAMGVVAPALAANIGVSIVDKSFAPSAIVVAQGDTVVWTVTKAIGDPHSVTSGKPTDADKGKAFDSGLETLKDNGSSYAFTFPKPGTYDYYCIVHQAEMTGRVVVLAPGESPPVAGGAETGITPDRRLIGVGILVGTLVVLFSAARFWRRMNPA